MRSTSNPTSKRSSRFELPNVDEVPPNSSGFLARSGTGRNYRDHRRRRSAPALDLRHAERRRSASNQEAEGGWWKMHWWKGDWKGKGKNDPDEGRDEGRGDREGGVR